MSGGEISVLLAIGLVAGFIGGLLGIGGTAIFIPAATLILGPAQHIYQAAAMILNVAVSLTATIKHARKGAIRKTVIRRMLPAAVALVLIGAWLSNHLEGSVLTISFGVLLWLIAASELTSLCKKLPKSKQPLAPREGRSILAPIGGIMGFVGGLLGVGGGIFAVPILQRWAHFNIREAVAASACVTLPMAAVGAVYKNATLHTITENGIALRMSDSLATAACLIPTAIIGSWIGASLVHRLPMTSIRWAFVGLLIFAGLRMTGVV
jgi:uncharacterized membrane protein YfcA